MADFQATRRMLYGDTEVPTARERREPQEPTVIVARFSRPVAVSPTCSVQSLPVVVRFAGVTVKVTVIV